MSVSRSLIYDKMRKRLDSPKEERFFNDVVSKCHRDFLALAPEEKIRILRTPILKVDRDPDLVATIEKCDINVYTVVLAFTSAVRVARMKSYPADEISILIKVYGPPYEELPFMQRMKRRNIPAALLIASSSLVVPLFTTKRVLESHQNSLRDIAPTVIFSLFLIAVAVYVGLYFTDPSVKLKNILLTAADGKPVRKT